MITTMAIVECWLAALRADVDLIAWAAGAFPGKTLTYFVGVSADDPPGERQAPFVALHPVARAGGNESPLFEHSVQITLGVIDQVELVDDVVRHKGLSLLEEGLAPLVLAACSSASANVSLSDLEMAFMADFSPLLLLGINVTCNVPALVGAELDI